MFKGFICNKLYNCVFIQTRILRDLDYICYKSTKADITIQE